MVSTNDANVYKEVLVVINNLVKEDYEKIPKEYIEFLEKNANSDYNFKYDNSKSFAEQKLMEDTKYILFGIFEKFGATNVQKEKIKAYEKSYFNKLEQEKLDKYNPNSIFNRKADDSQSTIKIDNEKSTDLCVAEHIDNFFTKFMNFIKSIFIKK